MKKLVFFLIIIPIVCEAQTYATTSKGDEVVLYADGTWKYKEDYNADTLGQVQQDESKKIGSRVFLQIDGWEWEDQPRALLNPADLPGRIVFNIELDVSGKLIGYRKESSTVSADTERACLIAIKRTSFKKPTPPEVSTGKIIFVLRPPR